MASVSRFSTQGEDSWVHSNPEEETPSGRVRIGQAALFLDEVARLRIAKLIVRAQVKSMRGLLQRYRRNGTAGIDASLDGMEGALDLTHEAASIEGLMGAEGQARAFLHDAFKVISEDARLDRRVRRPPPDPVNCLMSFFNMLLYSACASEAREDPSRPERLVPPCARNRTEIALDRHGRELQAGAVRCAPPVRFSAGPCRPVVVRIGLPESAFSARRGESRPPSVSGRASRSGAANSRSGRRYTGSASPWSGRHLESGNSGRSSGGGDPCS